MITRTVALTTILLMGLGPIALSAHLPFSPPDQLNSIFDEMSREEILDIVIETDISYLLDHRRSKKYVPALLRYDIPGKGEVSRNARIRLRGKYRRRVCDFPPLKLKFSEEELRESGLDPVFKSLKLVTHCLDGKFEGNENVLKEYLAYKLYGLHTDEAFRVQLVRVTYRDMEGKNTTLKRYGIIIEDPDQLAARLGGRECETDCLNPDTTALVETNAAVQNMFQFMIGNEDWDVMLMRNLKLIDLPNSGKRLLIPYDFDFSGLVNAEYAVPSSEDGLTAIKDRAYLGVPISDKVMRWTIKLYEVKKGEVLQYVRQFRPLSLGTRRELINYLEVFYNYLDQLNASQVDGLYEKMAGDKVIYQTAVLDTSSG